MRSWRTQGSQGRLARICLLLGFVWAVLSACPTGKTSGPCLTSDDCPEGELCIGTNCLGKPTQDATIAKEPPPQPEPTPPDTPAVDAKGGDTSAPDIPSPDAPGEQTGPDATPDTTTPDAESCRLDELRSCQHGCGTGTQRCRLGASGQPAWDACKPKETQRSCYSGKEGTANVGPCQKGSQTCEGDKWGPCVGAVTPQQEKCDDGVDNDCNGKTDETEAGCICKAGQTQACGPKQGACVQGKQTCNNQNQWGQCLGGIQPKPETCNGKDDDCDGKTDEGLSGKSCTIANAKGPCAKGIQSCDGTKVTCKAQVKPSKEVCDGKDNDCDGKIDDAVEGTGGSCTVTGKKGECAKGTKRCVAAKAGSQITCVPNAKAITEICRDGKDNDCDGKTDEICGPRLQMAAINSNGSTSFKTANITTVRRVAAGSYAITTKDGCGTQYPYPNKVPIFATVRGSAPRSTGYTCVNNTYTVYVGSTNAVDTPINVVFPSKRKDEVYGTFSSFCHSQTNVCGIHYAQQGNATAKRIAPGVYEISSSSCKSANQSYFAQIYFNKPGGYATMYFASSGKCRVNTYNASGTPVNLSFAYWIPSTSAMAWATIDGTGKVLVSNIFGDQRAKWQTVLNKNGGVFSNLEISFPAWNSKSTALLTPNGSGKHAFTHNTKKGGVVTYPVLINGKRAMPPRFSVMFLLP